jgi:D-sedoheptulose 7-phosphate isomerase
MSDYTQDFLAEAKKIIDAIDTSQIDRMAEIIVHTRSAGGRLFFLGVGGGAGHAGHAVNDFRKIAGIESYAPSDNVSELTARINDDGFDTAYANWLRVSRICDRDTVFIFSVGGGNEDKNISTVLVRALQLAKSVGAKVIGVVGRDGGFTAKVADAFVIVPSFNSSTVTPQVEAFQAVIWHLLVSHPRVLKNAMKWESVAHV